MLLRILILGCCVLHLTVPTTTGKQVPAVVEKKVPFEKNKDPVVENKDPVVESKVPTEVDQQIVKKEQVSIVTGKTGGHKTPTEKTAGHKTPTGKADGHKISTEKTGGHKILVLVPVGSRSLYHLCRALSTALGDAGHQVTLVSTFPPSVKHESVIEVHTGGDNSAMETPNIFNINSNVGIKDLLLNASLSIGQKMWSNEAIRDLWVDRNTFHAIVIIGYVNEIAAPFLLGYNGAYINFCTPGAEYQHLIQQGNWLPLSVIPSIILPFTNDMSFPERLVNLPTEIIRTFAVPFVRYRPLQRFLEEEGGFPGHPPLTDLYLNPSITLINGHFALDGPVPLLPTQVEIGTINANPPKPLPQDLEEFMVGAGEAGVILFSLGSLVKSSDIPKHYKAALVEGLGRVRQRVVWKYEGRDLDLPPNVITRKWLPQQDILGHNQTRVFISHCGNLGMQEAQYHGVPVLGLPVFFDQARNAARMQRRGYAVMLNWEDLTADSLVEALTTLTTDGRYQERLSLVSKAVKDQKESPGERAVWWIEYAIRHKGSPHLIYAGKYLNLFQYLMLDVLLFWLAVFSSLMFLVIFCTRKVCRCGSRKEKRD